MCAFHEATAQATRPAVSGPTVGALSLLTHRTKAVAASDEAFFFLGIKIFQKKSGQRCELSNLLVVIVQVELGATNVARFQWLRWVVVAGRRFDAIA